MGTCCFGGQPKLTDMIEVTLDEPLRIEYSMRKRKLAGIFKVDTQLKAIDGLGGVYYQLQANHRRRWRDGPNGSGWPGWSARSEG